MTGHFLDDSPAHCPHLGEVVAAFLDGAPRDTAPTEHLRGCRDCQRDLGRARRLDALLASQAGPGPDEAQAERWMTQALRAGAPAPLPEVPLARPGNRARFAAAVALALCTGIGLGTWLEQPGGGPTAPASNETAAVPRAASEHPTSGRSPALVLPNRTRPRTPDTRDGTPRRSRTEPAPEPSRDRVVAELVRSRRGSDQDLLHSQLATAAEGPEAEALRRTVRECEPAVRRLMHALQQRPPSHLALVAAARVGHPKLDEALLRLTRRQPELIDTVAAAMRPLDHRPGRTVLLLELCGHCEPDTLADYFRRLGGEATAELVKIARRTKHATLRRRCLHALAWRCDASAIPFLLEWIDCPSLDEALAAAHALSHLPAIHADKLAKALPRARRRSLLLAALCGVHFERAARHLRQAELTDEELDFLRGGAFSPPQLEIAARLCRRRSTFAD